jgi:hypothetical protein
MRNRVDSNSEMGFRGGSALILSILFCLQYNVLHAFGLEARSISEKPLITQKFDQATNETEVRVILNSNSFTADTTKILLAVIPVTISAPRQFARVQSGLVLVFAKYNYEGHVPTGKQSTSFAFFSKQKNTFNDKTTFTIITDGEAIQDGLTETPTQLGSDDTYRQKTLVIVPIELYLRISHAKNLQFKLGPKTYSLEDFQQKSIQALAKIIDPQIK